MSQPSLLLISSFLHERGGDTTLLFDGWAAYRKAGINVIPFAMRHPDNLSCEVDTRFPAWHAPREAEGLLDRGRGLLRSIWNPTAASALNALLAQLPPAKRPNAAHLHHLHRHLTPSILPVLKRHRVRVVWTQHDYEQTCPTGLRFRNGTDCDACVGGQYQNAIRGRCKDGSLWPSVAVALEKYTHRHIGIERFVDAFVAPSRHLAAALRRDGFAAHKVVYVPNFVTESVDVTPPHKTGVLFAGRLTREKGADLVLAAARQLPSIKFSIVGEGPERSALRKGAPSNVCFYGALPRHRVAAMLRETEIVVVPSRWPENQPYAVLEAQAAGCAVIAADCGGIPEMIAHGVDGLLIPPSDENALVSALLRLQAASQFRILLGQNAQCRSRQQSQTRWLSSMKRLLWPVADQAFHA